MLVIGRNFIMVLAYHILSAMNSPSVLELGMPNTTEPTGLKIAYERLIVEWKN